ncbi:hypothetical protein HOY82DRAFT_596726 [Tuber indicum]|nr:hypothetical protein HOY82DRAFT_596726 [Tuber indicum]
MEGNRTNPPLRDDMLPPAPPPPHAREPHQAVSVVEIAMASSAFDGVKVKEVSAAEVDEKALMQFVKRLSEDDEDESDGCELSDMEAPVMAGERARRFSDPAGGIPEVHITKQPVPKVKRKPIRMMVGREKFDFVSAFRDAPVRGLNWGSFFDLAPSVKKDICRLLVQERAKGLERGKGKGRGKKILVDAATQETPGDEGVLSVATDRDLGNVTNFYTRGILQTRKGRYRITRILVDARSVVNLMAIKVLKAVGAKLIKTDGMVIPTATNALARIAYYADIRITIGGVPCDLRVYALPAEYSPTYSMLLSRRWLQAVKAKGDYSNGCYYIMSGRGTRVQIPCNKRDKVKEMELERRHRPHVPLVLRDKEARKPELAAEIAEELELLEALGEGAFGRLLRRIQEEAEKQINEEEEDEDSDDDDKNSEDSEN